MTKMPDHFQVGDLFFVPALDGFNEQDEWHFVLLERESPCDSRIREIQTLILGTKFVQHQEYRSVTEALKLLSGTLYRP